MIARVLAQDPKVILLDEPISHLDLANQSRFLNLVKNLVSSGLTVLAVLHDPNIAFGYGDSFFFLKDGVIQKPKDEERPWDSPFLSEIYGIPVEVASALGRPFVIPCLPAPGNQP